MSEVHSSDIPIPNTTLQQWQDCLDMLCSIANIPAALIMRVSDNHIHVCSSSNSEGNPYQVGAAEALHGELYCEHVMRTRNELLVPNALADPQWDSNPDIPLGMISYCGLPLSWPSGKMFGTICMLDKKVNSYTEQQRKLLAIFQRSIQGNLALIAERDNLARQVSERTAQLESRNRELAALLDKHSAAEQTIVQLSRHDRDTGLPNTTQLELTYQRELDAGHQSLGMMHLRIADFLAIRDRLGSALCHRLKTLIAKKITRLALPDLYTACLGEGEFGILLRARDHAYLEKAMAVAHILSDKLQGKVIIDGQTFNVSLGVGISFSDSGKSFAELLRQASIATSTCIEKKSRFEFYAVQLQTKLSERIQMEALMFNALENSEFHLQYQPFVDVTSGEICGAEALMRWKSPILGAVSPEKFITVAESSGLIHELGYFALRSAIEQAARWLKQGGKYFRVAVNLSPVQFKDSQLSERITQLLTHYQLPGEALELELTESIFFDDEHHTLAALEKLRTLGVSISLDDFGTGYSSLYYLSKFPFSSVKIDRSFITDIEQSTKNQLLVNAIISMAKSLNLKVVAEGIENANQADFLKKLGADIWQGYYFGRPVVARDFSAQHLLCLDD
ncbi:MAG: bifunctional diguanylate cyclase/phosphodiesterase [Pseudomonadales bacterium]